MIANRRLMARALKDSVDGEFALDLLKAHLARQGERERFQTLIDFDQVAREEVHPSNSSLAVERSPELMRYERELRR